MPAFELAFTEHARRRKNQRCKCNDPIDVLLEHFDIDKYVGNGVWAWGLSRALRRDLLRQRVISPAMARRVEGLVLLVAEDNGDVVSLMHGGREIGRYLS